jgi:hypothetical protein
MVCTGADAIRFGNRGNIGRLSSVMMSNNNFWTVFPFPAGRAGASRRVYVLGVEQCSRPK